MTTPFDGRILLWHWQGAAVVEATVAELAAAVRAQTPNVSGVAVKSSNGQDWQGQRDAKASMAVTGPEALIRWVKELQDCELETHLWCVVHGRDPEAEAARIVTACGVPGVRSMILDVEAGEGYFGSQPLERVKALMARVREGTDIHLGLCFFVDDMPKLHFEAWLPQVSSLHPMLYHWDLSRASSGPEAYLDDAFCRLRPYGLPIVPLLQTYPEPISGARVPADHIYRAGSYAFQQGAVGISYFRLGAAEPAAFAAISRLAPRSEP